MNKLPIFLGLKDVPESVARDLAFYWKVAGDDTGTINSQGHLTTPQTKWPRPMAQDNFNALKEALKGNEAAWLTVEEDKIELDFSKLQYNLEWLKDIITKYELGVSDSEEGLVLYQKQNSNGNIWYADQAWRLKGVTAKKLGFEKCEPVALSPNMQNPRTAEWGELYFSA